MDQDGKSNVWAIEPKMEVENKSSEEKTGSVLAAVAGLGAFAVVAAGVLSNLPDPDQLYVGVLFAQVFVPKRTNLTSTSSPSS